MAAVAPPSSQRSYWQIVARQFQRNRRAVWGLRVIASMILVAILAPFLANDKPLVFHGYRYKLYAQTWDQLPYAHSDLAGLGAPERPLVMPGLYEDGIVLEGIASAYQADQARWTAGNPTWRMIQNVSFGEAEAPMNALRRALEEQLKTTLTRDAEWARGSRDVAWLKEQRLPPDLGAALDDLVKRCTRNVDQDYRRKTQQRRDAIVQQLDLMRREVGPADRAEIDALRERYETLVKPDFYKSPPPREECDALVLEARSRLDPRVVTFEAHTDFPALRQLGALDLLFLTALLLWLTRGFWGGVLEAFEVVDELTPRAAFLTASGLAVAASLCWWAAVPEFNDTTDYKRGMEDGSLFCDFRLVAPIRYGVNENDTEAKYRAPWWSPWGAPRASGAAPGAEGEDEPLAAVTTVAPSEQERLLRELEAGEQAARGTWQRLLDGLTRHHMGTDGTGRDLFTRMIWGSRISLSIGFVAVGIYVTIGVILGALAGYFGGWIDMLISRVIEVVICFPTFFLILTVIAFLDPSVWNIMLVIGITGWTGVARLVRGEFLSLRQQDFVIAGRALGFSDARIIFRHVLPNAMAPVLVAATFGVASAILIESSLSFLGFGVKVPTPTWGSVLSAARESWIYWWITVFPGAAIFLAVTMYNLVGEGVRDAVDPKLRQ